MKQHLNIRVYGLVQGIFYRASAQKEAQRLNLNGFTKNEDDGSVYIEAEGEKENLDKFIKWCNIGPSISQVEKVVVTEDRLKNFSQFMMY